MSILNDMLNHQVPMFFILFYTSFRLSLLDINSANITFISRTHTNGFLANFSSPIYNNLPIIKIHALKPKKKYNYNDLITDENNKGNQIQSQLSKRKLYYQA